MAVFRVEKTKDFTIMSNHHLRNTELSLKAKGLLSLKLKIQMSVKRQEIEKTRRLIRGLYENFVQGILTNDEYFELKADYEYAINALSGEIEVFEKSMDSLDNQLARYRAMEKDAKTLAQDHVLTAELIERLIERIEIDHERNIHVTFRFKNEFQGKAVEPCATM